MAAEYSMSAAERVSHIPELISNIMSFNTPVSNVNCSLTCKGLSNIALNAMWREIDQLPVVFSMLAPLSVEDESFGPPIMRFTRPLNTTDWNGLYEKYAPRVRHLKFQDSFFGELERSRHGLLNDEVFLEVARTRPNHAILPSLAILEWTASCSTMGYCTMFFHKGLKELSLSFDKPEDDAVPLFKVLLQAISEETPNLMSLSINAMFSVRQVQHELLCCLLKLPKLQKLILPRYWVTPVILSQLSKFPDIRSVGYQWPAYDYAGNVVDVQGFLLDLDHDSFGGLVELSIEADLNDIYRIFQNPARPKSLTFLSVSGLRFETPKNISRFLGLVSTVLPTLLRLHLLLLPHSFSSETFIIEDGSGPFITYDTIEPVLNFPELVEFCINYITPIELYEEDIIDLTYRWPHLEVLSLCPQPVAEPFKSYLSLGTLIAFMLHCPYLQSLSLWLNASIMPSAPFFHAKDLNDMYLQFGPDFRSLNVGSSVIEEFDLKLAASYLAHYLPMHDIDHVNLNQNYSQDRSTFYFVAGEPQREHPALQSLNWTAQFYKRLNIWRRIGGMLPAMIVLRENERKNVETKEHEIEKLREENTNLRAALYLLTHSCLTN